MPGCENGTLLRHRVECLEKELKEHDNKLDDLQRCVIKLTALEEKSERRSSQIFAAVLAVISGLAVIFIAAYFGLKS